MKYLALAVLAVFVATSCKQQKKDFVQADKTPAYSGDQYSGSTTPDSGNYSSDSTTYNTTSTSYSNSYNSTSTQYSSTPYSTTNSNLALSSYSSTPYSTTNSNLALSSYSTPQYSTQYSSTYSTPQYSTQYSSTYSTPQYSTPQYSTPQYSAQYSSTYSTPQYSTQYSTQYSSTYSNPQYATQYSSTYSTPYSTIQGSTYSTISSNRGFFLSSASVVSGGAEEQKLLDNLNQARTHHDESLTKLKMNTTLNRAAKQHAEQLKTLGYRVEKYDYPSHEAGGESFVQRMSKIPFEGKFTGENWALGSADSAPIMNLWLNSQGHRKNILEPSATDIGIAIVKESDSAIHYVTIFAHQ